MNPSPDKPEQDDSLVPLVLAHLDGRIGDEDFAALQDRLTADTEARSTYVRLAQLDAELRDDLEAADAADAEILPLPLSMPDGRPTPSNLGRVLAIAAAVALLATPVALWMRPSGGEVAQSSPNSPAGTARPAATPTRGVAVISAEAGAVWQDEESGHLVEGVALEPGRLILREGLAQIDFYGGASISLSGPAELELIGPDAAVLHRGRLRADVPPAARGFEIRSADVLIEDLGTSFGLAVGDNASAEVVVFDGEVRAISRDGEPLSLYGGDAAHLEKGQATAQAGPPSTEFPDIATVIAGAGDRDDSRYQAWRQASLDRRSDPRLIAYYDFEGLTSASRRLPNRALEGTGSELDGGIVGARAAQGRWPRKTALDFRLEGDRVRFQIPGEFEQLTLYAWVRIDALDRHLNSLFLTDYFDPNEIHWQVSREGRLHFATSPMGVEDIPGHNRRFYSESFWEPGMSGQWFLLATTVDRGDGDQAGQVIHYVNGEAVGMHDGTNREKPLPPMRIGQADLGNWSDPIWEHSIRTLNGRIDEFALFKTALAPEEILEIYQQGRP